MHLPFNLAINSVSFVDPGACVEQESFLDSDRWAVLPG
jgi:hypothetical protein